jgi:hypothetical protein
MKTIVLYILSLLCFNLYADAGELSLTAPPLREQPLIDSIYRIGGNIIVCTEAYDQTDHEWSNLYWQLNQDSTGKLWIASGLAHIVIRRAGLHLYDGKTITPIISESKAVVYDNNNMPVFDDFPDEGQKENIGKPIVAFSKIGDITGITINSKGEIVIVASEVGILAYAAGNTLRNLWKGSLRIEYKSPGFITVTGPQGIVEKDEILYVASRSLGVICFEKLVDGNYLPVRQIVFDLSSEKKK